MKVNVVMTAEGTVLMAVPPQEGVTFEEAQAAIRKLRTQLTLQGFAIAGEDRIESHIPDREHEAMHQAEKQAAT